MSKLIFNVCREHVEIIVNVCSEIDIWEIPQYAMNVLVTVNNCIAYVKINFAVCSENVKMVYDTHADATRCTLYSPTVVLNS
jgi:hypothetical protein